MPVLMRENTMIGNLAIKPGERESVSVTGDGTKTIQDLLYELAQKIDINKVKGDSYISMKESGTIEEITFSNDVHYSVASIMFSNYNGLDIIDITAINHELDDAIEAPGVDIYELKLSNASKDDNHYMKNGIFCSEGSQTPTMTLTYKNTDVPPAGSEIIFYY